ncbi:hypothetical protein GTQ45_01990 [Pyruvatibacter mobilis]|uniref:Uncharacterized protein n=1 Tax=Pyruvatibacter mobilis TaxID=1712261 RepID=A0A845Q7C8_9HYPH|nr:hypothetical protein [Pyruvatibacter mobilis]NBG94502.1 hypothetical protein [Pyruvatibacter mobilis]QJD74022.1 hypothetical protein HG718_00540 [Pyruvatibacter mobilis]
MFSAASSWSEQAEYAAEAETYRQAQAYLADRHRRRIEEYNNEVYAQDIQYANDILAYQRDEFQRQAEWFDESVGLIKKDYVNQLGTLLLRATEEAIAAQLYGEEAIRQGRSEAATAQVAAAERGIAGITARMLVNDTDRQVGEALTSIDRNRQAISRQLSLEALGLKARADSAINQLPLQTFQPIAPPTRAAPTSPVMPTAPVPQPSRGQLIGDVLGAGISGYRSLTKNSTPSTGGWNRS